MMAPEIPQRPWKTPLRRGVKRKKQRSEESEPDASRAQAEPMEWMISKAYRCRAAGPLPQLKLITPWWINVPRKRKRDWARTQVQECECT